MKEEYFHKFLQQEPTEVVTTLTSKWSRTWYKKKNDDICIKDLKRSFCWQLVSLLPLKTRPMSASYPPESASKSRPSWLLLLEPLSWPIMSFQEPSPTRSRQPSGSCNLQWLLIPGLTPRVSQKCLRLTHLASLFATDSPLRFVDPIILPNDKGVHSVGLMWVRAQEVLHMPGSISLKQVAGGHCSGWRAEVQDQGAIQVGFS